jgi:hypothetical protein
VNSYLFHNSQHLVQLQVIQQLVADFQHPVGRLKSEPKANRSKQTSETKAEQSQKKDSK